MKNPEKHFEKGIIDFFKSIYSIFIGITGLLLGDVRRFYSNKYREIQKNYKEKRREKILGNFLSMLIFTAILLSTIEGLISWGYWTWHANWTNEILISDSKKEIRDFFDLYNERFAAHDCNFMEEVGVDEAMFDKYNIVKRINYRCEEFVKYNEKIYSPTEIGEIKKTGNKYRVKGEMIVISKNPNEDIKITPLYFELWRLEDWPLWHFKDSPKPIAAELKYQ